MPQCAGVCFECPDVKEMRKSRYTGMVKLDLRPYLKTGMIMYLERRDMGVGECHRGFGSLSRVCGGRGRYPDICIFGA